MTRKPKRFQLRDTEQALELLRRIVPPKFVPNTNGRQVEFEEVELIEQRPRSFQLRINGFPVFMPASVVFFFAKAEELKPGWTGKVRIPAKFARDAGLL
jgi:hypothetical protein